MYNMDLIDIRKVVHIKGILVGIYMYVGMLRILLTTLLNGLNNKYQSQDMINTLNVKTT